MPKALRCAKVRTLSFWDAAYLVVWRIAGRTSKNSRRRACRLLSSPADVAQALSITVSRFTLVGISYRCGRVRTHYICFEVPKKSGGVRRLSAPHRDLAAAQRWIFQNVLLRLPTHPACMWFIKGRSIRSKRPTACRTTHVDQRGSAGLFPSITFSRVCGTFQHLGYSPAVATVLALICTEAPRRTVTYAGQVFHVATGPRCLPQGACMSPAALEFDCPSHGLPIKRHCNQIRLVLHAIRGRFIVFCAGRSRTGSQSWLHLGAPSTHRSRRRLRG